LSDALLFRGYAFGAIEKRWGSHVAIGVTAALTVVGSAVLMRLSLAALLGSAAMGLLAGVFRARSWGVAAPWIAQLTFVWTQVGLLHVPFGPIQLDAPPGFALSLNTPGLLSGAGYGLEGGLIGAAVMIGAAWWLLRDVPVDVSPRSRPQ
jgi:membrane protease YdiL (CAAX protease family)